MNFQSHLSNEVGCCQRALSESVDRARAEQRATREQLAADQQCFFNHIDDLWNREKDRNQNVTWNSKPNSTKSLTSFSLYADHL